MNKGLVKYTFSMYLNAVENDNNEESERYARYLSEVDRRRFDERAAKVWESYNNLFAEVV